MTTDEYQSIDLPPRTGFWQFLDSLRAGFKRSGPWLTIGLLLWATGLTLALPTYQWFDSTIAHAYAPGDVVHQLGGDFSTDHSDGMGALRSSLSASLAFFQIIAVLGGVFAAGGWLQVILERRKGSDLRRFLYGAGRYWWRFLRVFLCVAGVLILWNWVFYELPWNRYVLEGWKDMPQHTWDRGSRAFGETLGSEMEKARLIWLQDGLFTAFFALTLAWAIYVRTRLALLDDRSVLWAGACAFFMMLRHPWKTLRPLVMLFLLEFLVVSILLGYTTRWLDGQLAESATRGTILAMGLIGLIAVLFREVLRGSQYHAAVRVSQELIRPTLRPDPWQTIGGPGGPQYPVDDDHGERYGVAL